MEEDYINNDDKIICNFRTSEFYAEGSKFKPFETFINILNSSNYQVKKNTYSSYDKSLLYKCINYLSSCDYIDIIHYLILTEKVFVNYIPTQENIDFIKNRDIIKYSSFYNETSYSPLMDLLIKFKSFDTDLQKEKWLECVNYLIDNKVYCNKKIITLLKNRLEQIDNRIKEIQKEYKQYETTNIINNISPNSIIYNAQGEKITINEQNNVMNSLFKTCIYNDSYYNDTIKNYNDIIRKLLDVYSDDYLFNQ